MSPWYEAPRSRFVFVSWFFSTPPSAQWLVGAAASPGYFAFGKFFYATWIFFLSFFSQLVFSSFVSIALGWGDFDVRVLWGSTHYEANRSHLSRQRHSFSFSSRLLTDRKSKKFLSNFDFCWRSFFIWWSFDGVALFSGLRGFRRRLRDDANWMTWRSRDEESMTSH